MDQKFSRKIVSHQAKAGHSMERLDGTPYQIKRVDPHLVISQPRILKIQDGAITHLELTIYTLHPHTHRLQVSLYPRNPDLMD